MLCWVLGVLLLSQLCHGKPTAKANNFKSPKFTKELFATNVSNNLNDWDSDMAIIFYAPWCKYCKQILPYWEAIAELTGTKKDLTVGNFNCETPAENAEFCHKLGVDRYPSIYFIGYGNYHQAPKGENPVAKNPYPNLVRYSADLYPEALIDWINMLYYISSVKRGWSDVVGMFTGNPRLQTRMRNLEKRLLLSEKRSYVFGKELEKYKATAVFDKLKDLGDPFPLLSEMEPDENNRPFRICITDMAAEFCQYFPDEDYCMVLDRCTQQELEPQACRPSKCPFEDKRGCTVLSMCMDPSIIQPYIDALSD